MGYLGYILGLYLGHIWIMEKKMETTILAFYHVLLRILCWSSLNMSTDLGLIAILSVC